MRTCFRHVPRVPASRIRRSLHSPSQALTYNKKEADGGGGDGGHACIGTHARWGFVFFFFFGNVFLAGEKAFVNV